MSKKNTLFAKELIRLNDGSFAIPAIMNVPLFKKRLPKPINFSKKKAIVDSEGKIKINIKPLSVNKCFTGVRYKTDAYKLYKQDVNRVLPIIKLPNPPFKIYYKFGFSNSASDWDNAIKTTTDVLSTFYNFNDKLIRKGVVETEIVPVGMDYFEFKIENIND